MAEWLSKGQKASNNMKKKRNASENNDEENDPNDSGIRKSAKKE